MSYEAKLAIFNKIKEYDRIFLFRHIRMDGDCTGATKGLQALLKASFPEKEIHLLDNQSSGYLAFLGEDEKEAEDSFYEGALAIVLDTATPDRISSGKYTLCKELIKIDHHINVNPYGDLLWVEEEASSCCEMIASFYDTFKDSLTMTPEAALYLYTGMVTDSGRFRFRSVSGETLRLAGILLNQGIDTDTLYAHLYLNDFDVLKFRAEVYRKMKITENGVAYIHVTEAMQEKFHLSREDASAVVSALDSIKGSLIWIAFIDNGDGTIRVRLRSRFVTINSLAERYHGGGHAMASGATAYTRKEMNALIKEADQLLGDYKANNGGWL
ncbi:MAG: bifunctional oligoribonuclease/PAP phosphatase NrnA [Clostridia bacterium]|nr:bifunctional oligoribonuclease/PAP phosphatase NrnA [Clostridia bacterium]